MTTFAEHLGSFTCQLELSTMPLEVAEKAKVCLLNGYGMGLNCHDTPYAPVARAAALASDGEVSSGATLLCDGRRTTIGGACLANSALFHGRAQEDSCGAAHFGTILLPLLTAMIEAKRYPVARLIPALVAGYEAGGTLEAAYAGQTTPAGFRSTATYGVVAAAAAAARLMELDTGRTAAALANAVSFTGGVLQSFADGTDEWRYQPGIVARSGLVAAELARAGSVSALHAFEGKAGLIRSFARTDCNVSELAHRPGQGVGNSSRGLQTLPGLRVQPDTGDRRPVLAQGHRRRTHQGCVCAHEPLRMRVCRDERIRPFQFDLRHTHEHPILYRANARARRS